MGRDGRVVREAVDGRQNVCTDRLEYLREKSIDEVQYAAGRRLQADAQLAEIMSYGQPGGGRGGPAKPGTLPDAKLDAQARVKRAQRAVGDNHWRYIDLICLQSWPVIVTARLYGDSRRKATALLRLALDALAQHYGLRS